MPPLTVAPCDGPERGLFFICFRALHEKVSERMNANESGTRLLYDRKTAAQQLSISTRALDRLIANKCLNTRRVGSRVLIPHAELTRFARADHPTINCA
jgi:excisionase family DNA binding protein